MSTKKVCLSYKGKKFCLEVKVMDNIFKRFWGLMFKRKKSAVPLLFPFEKSTNTSIHSFFCFFSFIAIWLDENGKIIEIRTVNPFIPSIKPKKEFKTLIEIPIDSRYREFIGLLVGD